MVELRHTTCVMDCPDTCALEVEVRDGRVAAIRGGRGRRHWGYGSASEEARCG